MINGTVKIAVVSALLVCLLFLIVGYIGAVFLVSIFWVSSVYITDLATNGIKLFFIGYLFMGINFIYMTYYQSIGYIRPSLGIIVFRGFILLIGMLYILPMWIGINGIWLALPISEAIVAVFLVIIARKAIMERELKEHGF